MAFTVRPVSPNVAFEVEDLSSLPDVGFVEDIVVISPPPSTGYATGEKRAEPAGKRVCYVCVTEGLQQ
jgi:hypothetical protein